jgi:glycosyltransferase involved in cell wall biosynthesis
VAQCLRLFINAFGASAGGGVTYVRNVIPHLAARPDVRTTFLLRPGICQGAQFDNIIFVEREGPRGTGKRWWYEQSVLPDLIRRTQSDVLLSAGNFALRKSPVPQILLSRNSLYCSEDFFRDLRSRADYKLWLDTKIKAAIARRSVAWSDVTVAPSEAFAVQLRRWNKGRIISVHHGFDSDTFFGPGNPLAPEVADRLRQTKDSVRLLLVSHYNYYRNFETLLRAIPPLRQVLPGRDIKLFLTCTLRSEDNPGTFCAKSAADLVRRSGIGSAVVELGAIPYAQLHHLYGACDFYVTPAYTETFAHHVVEAMASGLPVIASDLPVHREICGPAAQYFPAFSPEALAGRVAELVGSPKRASDASIEGLKQSHRFSWARHVGQIVELAGSLAGEMRQAAKTTD